MSITEIVPESRSRIPLPRREDLNSEDQKISDCFTSGSKGVLRGLHGPAGRWLHEPKLAEVYVSFGNYLRFGAGLSEPVREACVLGRHGQFANVRLVRQERSSARAGCAHYLR